MNNKFLGQINVTKHQPDNPVIRIIGAGIGSIAAVFIILLKSAVISFLWNNLLSDTFGFVTFSNAFAITSILKIISIRFDGKDHVLNMISLIVILISIVSVVYLLKLF